MRLNFGKHVIVANKVEQPKMKNVNGKEWKKIPMLLGKQKVNACQDVNYGEYFFFPYKGSWYGCRIIQDSLNTGTEVVVDPNAGKQLVLTPIERYKRVEELA
jgi:hypothetical protein